MAGLIWVVGHQFDTQALGVPRYEVHFWHPG